MTSHLAKTALSSNYIPAQRTKTALHAWHSTICPSCSYQWHFNAINPSPSADVLSTLLDRREDLTRWPLTTRPSNMRNFYNFCHTDKKKEGALNKGTELFWSNPTHFSEAQHNCSSVVTARSFATQIWIPLTAAIVAVIQGAFTSWAASSFYFSPVDCVNTPLAKRVVSLVTTKTGAQKEETPQDFRYCAPAFHACFYMGYTFKCNGFSFTLIYKTRCIAAFVEVQIWTSPMTKQNCLTCAKPRLIT